VRRCASQQPTRRACVSRLFGPLITPLHDVVAVESDTENIGGNEPGLGRLDSDYADNSAIQTCNDPTLPVPLSDENGRAECKKTRNIVEPYQSSVPQSIDTTLPE